MSLDGAFLHCVKSELENLIGARVDKISQPSREEIVISLRMLNSNDRGAKRLMFSANGGSARVHLTNAEIDNPQTPPMFCMLLRKRLGGGKLAAIRQDGLERILYFDFECTNEIGDPVTNTVIIEIMGRYSNIILMSGGRVVDSVKRITGEDAPDDKIRRVLPNIVYETPPRPERLNILEAAPEEIVSFVSEKGGRLAKALPEVIEGIAPIFAREAAFYTANDTDIPCDELADTQKRRLCGFLENTKSALIGDSQRAKFTMLTDETGKNKDFSFVDIGQYGNAMKVSYFGSACELLDEFYTVQSSENTRKQRSKSLMTVVNNASARVARKLELQRKELDECKNREDLKICGDLINANIYKLERGMSRCVLDDFYSGGTREIMLDVRLAPSQNAQKYYTEYRKLDTAEKKLTELIQSGENELQYLDSVTDSISRAENDRELSEIRRELVDQGYIKGENRKTPEKNKLSEPMRFTSSDGFEIFVGKNNRQNDQLTLKTAKATDIWLHTKDIAGSHVIVRTNGQELPGQTLFEAAQLAAYHSKGRGGSGVPVDYTAVKFVKKPAGAKPGMVIFTNNKTLYITPDKELVDSLSERK